MSRESCWNGGWLRSRSRKRRDMSGRSCISPRETLTSVEFHLWFWRWFAGVAQLVERDVPNVNVEGSNPFARFFPLLSIDLNRWLWWLCFFVDKVVLGLGLGVIFGFALPN
jgi:hypothetical protein